MWCLVCAPAWPQVPPTKAEEHKTESFNLVAPNPLLNYCESKKTENDKVRSIRITALIPSGNRADELSRITTLWLGPDRYHTIYADDSELIQIGSTTYIKTPRGEWEKSLPGEEKAEKAENNAAQELYASLSRDIENNFDARLRGVEAIGQRESPDVSSLFKYGIESCLVWLLLNTSHQLIYPCLTI